MDRVGVFARAVLAVLSIGGLSWLCWLLFRTYRDYRVNLCCKEMVALRREMLEWTRHSKISFNQPAYCTLRKAMNGLISVCQLTSPLEIVFVLISGREKSEAFAERVERAFASLDVHARAQFFQFRERMHLIVLKYLTLCPLVMLTGVGPVLVWALIKYRYATFLDWFQTGFDRLDEVALSHEADDILNTIVNTTIPLRGALHSRVARIIRAYVRPYLQPAYSSLAAPQRASHRRTALPPQPTPYAWRLEGPESRLIVSSSGRRSISLSFYGALGLPVRVGPAPWFRVTGNFMHQGPHSAVAGKFQNNTWDTAGQHYASYAVEGSAVVQFEDAFGGRSDILGPFDSIQSADGHMWANSELFADFVNETQLWHDIKTDTYWPVMVITSAEIASRGFDASQGNAVASGH
jgi:hypothetical protein